VNTSPATSRTSSPAASPPVAAERPHGEHVDGGREQRAGRDRDERERERAAGGKRGGHGRRAEHREHGDKHRPDHDVAVGEGEHARQPVDEAEAERDQAVGGPRCQARDERLDRDRAAHRRASYAGRRTAWTRT
jgi:hypothetical protein